MQEGEATAALGPEDNLGLASLKNLFQAIHDQLHDVLKSPYTPTADTL